MAEPEETVVNELGAVNESATGTPTATDAPQPPLSARVTTRRRDGKRVAKAVATSVAGVGSIALVTAVGLLGSWLTPVSGASAIAPVQAQVPAGDVVSVCPAPPRLLSGAGDGTDAQFAPESTTSSLLMRSITLSDPNGRFPFSAVQALDGKTVKELSKAAPPLDGGAAGLPDQKAAVEDGRKASGTELLRVGTLDGKESQGAAVQSYSAADGDLQGLASASCLTPSSDQWLLGASTQVGRTAVLNLSNPTTTPATVNLELFSGKGPVKAPGSRGITVAPGETRSLVVAGLAAGQDQVSIHVTSSGGAVAASIQQSVLRGLTPGGLDVITPAAAPALQQVIPGVSLSDPAAFGRLGEGFADAGPAVQITVPGLQDASVSLKVFSKAGQQVFSSGVVTVKGGSVSEVPLGSLPAGDYTIALSSDTSFTATARIARAGDAKDPVDFAYTAAGIPIGTQQLVPVPSGNDVSLIAGSPRGNASLSYRPVTADGKVGDAVKVDLAGSRTATIAVPGASGGAAVVGFLLSASGDPAFLAVVQTQNKGTGISVVELPRGTAGVNQLAVRTTF